MKKNILIFVMLLVFSAAFVFQGCKEEPVAYEEFAAFTIPELVAPLNGTYVDLEGETTIDLQWSSTNADGDPQKWDVHFGKAEDPALVASDYTSQTYNATVEIGTKYYWYVVGYDKRGTPAQSEIWSFEVIDPNALFSVDMTWTTNIEEIIGIVETPENVINLRLLILEDDTATLAAPVINTTGFETFKAFNSLPDGTYIIATDFSQTIDAGDFNEVLDVSIDLRFSQRGILSKKLTFPTVMTNEFNCYDYKTILATVVKTGLTYTVDAAVSYILPDPSQLVGEWNGDDAGYTSIIETTVKDGVLLIDSVGVGWMLNDWGEPCIETFDAEVIFNTCAGTISIPQQEFMNTTWLGDPQPTYSIKGTGTLDLSGAYPVIVLNYDFVQVDGAGAIARYFGIPYFTATITLDPAGKGIVNLPSGGAKLSLKFPKPGK